MTEQTYKATDKGTRLNNPQTRLKALADTVEWIKETGLFLRAFSITYKVAAVSIEGLENDCKQNFSTVKK